MYYTLFAFFCCKFEFKITRILVHITLFKCTHTHLKNQYINYSGVEIIKDLKNLKLDYSRDSSLSIEYSNMSKHSDDVFLVKGELVLEFSESDIYGELPDYNEELYTRLDGLNNRWIVSGQYNKDLLITLKAGYDIHHFVDKYKFKLGSYSQQFDSFDAYLEDWIDKQINN